MQNVLEANVRYQFASDSSPFLSQQVEDPESSLKDTKQQDSLAQSDPAGSETVADGKEDVVESSDVNDETRETGGETSNKFYCYICNITCHNQQVCSSHIVLASVI